MSTIVKTQHVRCLSIREIYTMMMSGQPINAHFHKLFDAPDCDLDDDRIVMCPDTDDVMDLIQAQTDQLLIQKENKPDNESVTEPEPGTEPPGSVPPVEPALDSSHV